MQHWELPSATELWTGPLNVVKRDLLCSAAVFPATVTLVQPMAAELVPWVGLPITILYFSPNFRMCPLTLATNSGHQRKRPDIESLSGKSKSEIACNPSGFRRSTAGRNPSRLEFGTVAMGKAPSGNGFQAWNCLSSFCLLVSNTYLDVTKGDT